MKIYTLSGNIDEEIKQFIIEATKKLSDERVCIIDIKTLEEVEE